MGVVAQTTPLLTTNEMIVDKKEFQQMKALVDQQQEQIKLLLTGFG